MSSDKSTIIFNLCDNDQLINTEIIYPSTSYGIKFLIDNGFVKFNFNKNGCVNKIIALFFDENQYVKLIDGTIYDTTIDMLYYYEHTVLDKFLDKITTIKNIIPSVITTNIFESLKKELNGYPPLYLIETYGHEKASNDCKYLLDKMEKLI